MQIRLLIILMYCAFLAGCKKFVEPPGESCFIPYVDFVAHQVNPATLDVTFNSITSYNGKITSHQWDFGDGTTFSGETPPPHRYPSPTSSSGTKLYRIKYKVANECGEAYWTKDITIGGCLPDVKFTYSMLNDSTVQINNTSTSATPITYLYNFGDGTTSTSAASSITKTYTQDQTFTVALKATNSCGENFFTSAIKICRTPVPVQTITQTTCSSVSIDASATKNGGRYQWNFGNGVTLPATPASSPTISYTYPASGTYTIKLLVINSSGCDTAETSNTVNIAANSLVPNNLFNYTSDDLEYSFSRPAVTNATSYKWSFGDGTTSTEQNPVKVYTNPGVYTLTLDAFSSCGGYSFASSITVPFYKTLSNAPNIGFMDVVALSPQQIYYLGVNGKLYKTDTAGNWSSAINLPSSLTFNSDTRLFKDINGNLWIYGKNAVSRYNVSSFSWTSFYNTTGFSGGTTIKSIAVTSDGTLWTISDKQVRRGNTVISSADIDFTSIAFAPETGRIWITSAERNVLYYANVNGNNLNTVSVTGINNGADEIKVHPNGDIYFTTGTGIIRTNGTGSLLNHYNTTNTNGLLVDEPTRFEFDEKNNLWVVHDKRLIKIPVNASNSAKNYSFNADLNNISAIEILIISGMDTDILLAKTSGNVATKIR